MAAPHSEDKYMFDTMGISNTNTRSNSQIKTVVKKETKKVFIAMSLPRTKKEITIRLKFKIIENVPGESEKNLFNIIAIPLVPPSNSL